MLNDEIKKHSHKYKDQNEKKTWLFTSGHYNEKSSSFSSFLFNNNNKKNNNNNNNKYFIHSTKLTIDWVKINMKIKANDYCFSLYNMILFDIVIYVILFKNIFNLKTYQNIFF
jgi:hypothetical protein